MVKEFFKGGNKFYKRRQVYLKVMFFAKERKVNESNKFCEGRQLKLPPFAKFITFLFTPDFSKGGSLIAFLCIITRQENICKKTSF